MARNSSIPKPEQGSPVLRQSGSSLIFEQDYVIKRQPADRALAEYHKSEIASRIAKETQAFTVPKVISFDESSGEIIFERLHGMVPYLQGLRNDRDPEGLVQRATMALATIHSQKSFPNPNLGSCKGGLVFTHGDFGLENILYVPGHEELVIIDWSVASWLTQPIMEFFTQPTLDLMVFLFSLFHRRPFSPNPIPRIHRLGRIFLSTYFSQRTDWSVEDIENQLRSLSSELAMNVRQYHYRAALHKGRMKALFYYPSLLDLQRFIRTINARNM